MKAAFRVEAIGFESDLIAAWRRLGNQRAIRRSRPWVAELLGPCPRFGYQRRFLRPAIDHTRANNKGTRGVIYQWVLEPGRFYEARYQVAWHRGAHRFLSVTPGGDIADVAETEITARWEEQEGGQWTSVGSESMS